MKHIPLVIMTYGRANLKQQLTWKALSEIDKSRVIFACRPEEQKFFSSLANTFVLRSATDLKSTRQEIWNHFTKNHEFWTQIDDDTKSFMKIESADLERKPMFKWVYVESHEALQSAEQYIMNHKDVGTCSPLQPFRPPRIPKGDHRWATSLVVGCNTFASERFNDFRFTSNYCADAEMVLTMLSKGLDTVWLDNYKIHQCPPTKNAEIRTQSVDEWNDLYNRFKNYIDYTGTSTSGWTSSKMRNLHDNPAKLYRMNRSKLLRDARNGTLKGVTLS